MAKVKDRDNLEGRGNKELDKEKTPQGHRPGSGQRRSSQREWQDALKALGERTVRPRIICPEGYSDLKERKSFWDERRVRELTTTKTALRKC